MEWYCFMWSFYPWASVQVVWLPRLCINKRNMISHMCPALCSLQRTFTFMAQFNSSYKLFIPISQIKRQRLPNQWIIFTVILHWNGKGIYCLSCSILLFLLDAKSTLLFDWRANSASLSYVTIFLHLFLWGVPRASGESIFPRILSPH